jgi:hypothetical protein
MIKWKGPMGQKNLLLGANKQKILIFFLFNYKTALKGSHLLASSTGRDEDDTLHD